ncbi:MAG: bifunctional glycosyltransferase family 2/GtrA family protein [Desulfovibrionaceae bacterium]|nr:bifunctional glycosyltransferase family 2/GtrA family protein [Desulfovibrionaceae bacterium]
MEAPLSVCRPVALIPAYKPEPAILDTARALLASRRIAHVVVVNDGSGAEYDPFFRELTDMGATVLRHPANLGKGMALRTGLKHIARAFPRSVGVVTLDADGQHLVKDVLATAARLLENPRALILGCRSFGQNTPLRSRMGNITTRLVMRVLAGLNISDTQTGLRGIPLFLVPKLLRLRTTGYDFELDMLILAKKERIPVAEVPIDTVYIDGNRSSHFHPLLDSMKIYLVFLRYNLSSLLTAGVDYAVFMTCTMLGLTLAPSMALGRGCSWAVNYGINRSFVFPSDKGWQSLMPYLLFEISMAMLAYIGIDFLHRTLSLPVYGAKVLVESSLYLLTFTVQREIVFGPAACPRETYDLAEAQVLSREKGK